MIRVACGKPGKRGIPAVQNVLLVLPQTPELRKFLGIALFATGDVAEGLSHYAWPLRTRPTLRRDTTTWEQRRVQTVALLKRTHNLPKRCVCDRRARYLKPPHIRRQLQARRMPIRDQSPKTQT